MQTAERALLLTTLILGALAVGFGALLLVDPRTIDGAPAWLKPLKFAVSTAIYSATLIWMGRYLTSWPRMRAVTLWTTAVVLMVEVGLIAVQAGRGTSSHFNMATPFDAVVFAVMGAAIFSQTFVAAAFTAALWRQRFEDDALGWALRLGMAITVAGALTGGLMTQPSGEQLTALQAGQSVPRIGGHTVGAPDGGPGLPGTGWSTSHGDLRVPHFVGLHAMQALPLLLLVVGRRVRLTMRSRFVMGVAALYASLFGVLLAQALAGQPVMQPRGGFLVSLGVWAVAVAGFALWTRRGVNQPRTESRGWRTA